MVKSLYPAPARLKLMCIVSSIKNKKMFSTAEIGTNSMEFASRQYRDTKIVKNAKLNAIYKHMKRGGGSDATVKVEDFDIEYFDNFVTRKKVFRFDKRTNKKEFWSEVRDSRTKKLVGRSKWKLAETIHPK